LTQQTADPRVVAAGPLRLATERRRRGFLKLAADFLTFPIRALLLYSGDRLGLSAISSERYDYVAREVRGYCLDVGCGRYNRFVTQYLGGEGVGVDVYPYAGLGAEQLLKDRTKFPFPAERFDSVTFIATINHIAESHRDAELREAFRVLRPGGNVIITMGTPVAMVLVHRLLHFYDRVLGTSLDIDGERGMEAEEAYYLADEEIRERLERAGFGLITKKRFLTQWGLNHLLIGWKPAGSRAAGADPVIPTSGSAA
jgi:ubiquinone/menaquinone biosynthesis C-methylase UbiE